MAIWLFTDKKVIFSSEFKEKKKGLIFLESINNCWPAVQSRHSEIKAYVKKKTKWPENILAFPSGLNLISIPPLVGAIIRTYFYEMFTRL